MRLTLYSDYSMRVLVYLATHADRLCSIAEIARGYGISQNHLMKVVNALVRAGYVESVRGRFGGIRLGQPAEMLNVGDIIRHTEEGFDLVDCPNCVISPACGLRRVLCEAVRAFLDVLDRYTVADLVGRREALAQLLGPAALKPQDAAPRDILPEPVADVSAPVPRAPRKRTSAP